MTQMKTDIIHWENSSVMAGHEISAEYLTIIPKSIARMGSESIAHEAEGRMGY